MLAVLSGFCQEQQQNIALLSGDVVCSERLQRFGKIDHLQHR